MSTMPLPDWMKHNPILAGGSVPGWLDPNEPTGVSLPTIPQAPQMPQPGMMGAPKKRSTLEMIGDVGLAFSAGYGNQGAQQMLALDEERKREAARQRQLEVFYNRKREDDYADFVRKEQFKRDNPSPVNNDTVADYNFFSQQLGPEFGNQYLRNKVDPIVNIPLPGGDVYIGPRSGMGSLGGGAAAPTSQPKTPESILQGGETSGIISPEEAEIVRSSLGPNGQSAFETWRRRHGVRVGKPLSNGQMAYFVNGKWYDNPEGR